MAETYDIAIAPHCPLGPIALAACIQVGITTPNCKLITRKYADTHTYNDVVDVIQEMSWQVRHRTHFGMCIPVQ